MNLSWYQQASGDSKPCKLLCEAWQSTTIPCPGWFEFRAGLCRRWCTPGCDTPCQPACTWPVLHVPHPAQQGAPLAVQPVQLSTASSCDLLHEAGAQCLGGHTLDTHTHTRARTHTHTHTHRGASTTQDLSGCRFTSCTSAVMIHVLQQETGKITSGSKWPRSRVQSDKHKHYACAALSCTVRSACMHACPTGSSRYSWGPGLTTSSILFLRPSVSFMTLSDSSRRSSYTLVPPISFSRSNRSWSFIVVMAMICIAQAQHQQLGFSDSHAAA